MDNVSSRGISLSLIPVAIFGAACAITQTGRGVYTITPETQSESYQREAGSTETPAPVPHISSGDVLHSYELGVPKGDILTDTDSISPGFYNQPFPESAEWIRGDDAINAGSFKFKLLGIEYGPIGLNLDFNSGPLGRFDTEFWDYPFDFLWKKRD
jgi:hypothetical protein